MTTFDIKRHIEINESYQGINLTEFYFESDKDIDNDTLVDIFIRSTHFSVDCLADVVKNNPENKPYLRQAFDIDKITIADFKIYNKEGVAEYLLDILNDIDYWGDNDREDFKKFLDNYFVIYNKFNDIQFYIISIDWFGEKDQKIVEPESWIYGYYYLIISVDRNTNLFTLSEWAYD